MRSALRSAALICLLGFGLLTVSAEARPVAHVSVSALRIGLIGSRSPRMGPRLVMRGGFTPITDMVRPRFAGGMIDIYPRAQSGFRFSVGTRYFARPNIWRDAEQATNGLLYDPHMTRGSIGLVRAYRRYTPALTAGYDVELINGVVVGLEGGMLTGRAINPGPRGARFSSDERTMAKSGMNPVATFSVRYAF